MRRIISSTFVSIDGVMQAPGAPEEDPVGGFAFGGWTAPHWAGDEVLERLMGEGFAKPFDLLLGRKTYDIFAAYWPYQPDDDFIRQVFDKATKYVATRTLKTFDWVNTVSLGDDPVAALKRIKVADGPDLLIQGSSDFVQTLLPANLIDETKLLTFPVVLGRGKRLFGAGAIPAAFKLRSSVASGNGVVISTYVPDGAVATGTFAQQEPSAAELRRRANLA